LAAWIRSILPAQGSPGRMVDMKEILLRHYYHSLATAPPMPPFQHREYQNASRVQLRADISSFLLLPSSFSLTGYSDIVASIPNPTFNIQNLPFLFLPLGLHPSSFLLLSLPCCRCCDTYRFILIK
jgi:hypothetical protein